MHQIIQAPISIDALDLDGPTCRRFLDGNSHIESVQEASPSPSPRPITTSDRFFPSKIAQFRSEYQLKDHLKEPVPFESVTQIMDHSASITPKRSISKVLSDQTISDGPDRNGTLVRRYSSSDIDYQSNHLMDTQTRHLLEQQKKRRIYNFNHTLFSNIYKRTHRSSSIDSHLCPAPVPSTTTTTIAGNHRERPSRHRHHSARESDLNDDINTTSDRVYSQALEKTTLQPPSQLNPSYRTALSVPDGGGVGRVSLNLPIRLRSSDSGTTSESLIENGHSFSESHSSKGTKLNGDGTSRTRKLPFLSVRRRASYFPSGTSNGSVDDSKRKPEGIQPLKRSYSYDTPFHRDAIEALNKGE